jgi:GNAT superfamily N-acetyltransferase
MQISEATSIEQMDQARELFQEYAASLGFSLCFQNFERELADLPGKYAPPTGRLLLAFVDDQLAGCVALRQLDTASCEIKRLFTRPQFRNSGLGRGLIERIIDEAKMIGYERMLLDTVPGKMDSAIRLYERFGFHNVEAYYSSALEGTRYMELKL